MRLVLIATALTGSVSARADRYEATITMRPTGVLARVDDTGVDTQASVPGGGAAAGLSWGVRNWLDVGLEVGAVALREARYDSATLPVASNDQTGELFRTTRAARAQVGATLRFGVGWVPSLYVGVGAGARQRTDARLRVQVGQGTADLIPDGGEAEWTVDLVATVRAGLDHRINRRWSLGLVAGVTQCIGAGTPDIQMLEGALVLGYRWYPMW